MYICVSNLVLFRSLSRGSNKFAVKLSKNKWKYSSVLLVALLVRAALVYEYRGFKEDLVQGDAWTDTVIDRQCLMLY